MVLFFRLAFVYKQRLGLLKSINRELRRPQGSDMKEEDVIFILADQVLSLLTL